MSHDSKSFAWKLTVIIIAALFAIVSVSGCTGGTQSVQRGMILPDIGITGSTDYMPYTSGTVSIPAVSGLRFIYENQIQYVQFENPDTNPCCLQISIYLSDGTLVYTSSPLRPGDVLQEILPLVRLMPGIYRHSILVFDCMSLDEPYTPLMRCEFEIEIYVYEGAKG